MYEDSVDERPVYLSASEVRKRRNQGHTALILSYAAFKHAISREFETLKECRQLLEHLVCISLKQFFYRPS